jgi:hypothetical protein
MVNTNEPVLVELTWLTLSQIFGGGEFLMELVDVVKDVPEFDAAWVDFAKYYNANSTA